MNSYRALFLRLTSGNLVANYKRLITNRKLPRNPNSVQVVLEPGLPSPRDQFPPVIHKIRKNFHRLADHFEVAFRGGRTRGMEHRCALSLAVERKEQLSGGGLLEMGILRDDVLHPVAQS